MRKSRWERFLDMMAGKAGQPPRRQRDEDRPFPLGRALGIFHDIWNPDVTDEEKGDAIRIVMGMGNHRGIRREAMVEVIRYLLQVAYLDPEEEAALIEAGILGRDSPDGKQEE